MVLINQILKGKTKKKNQLKKSKQNNSSKPRFSGPCCVAGQAKLFLT
jgi:hypothetical protein